MIEVWVGLGLGFLLFGNGLGNRVVDVLLLDGGRHIIHITPKRLGQLVTAVPSSPTSHIPSKTWIKPLS
jgi:hypothetical protein